AAAFVVAGWVSPDRPSTWSRLGAAYLFGLVLLVVPASYLVLLGVPVALTAVLFGLVVVALAARRLLRSPPLARPALRAPGLDAGLGLAVTAGTLVLLAYSARTFAIRPLVEYDAWAIWAAKARLIYDDPGIAAGVLRGG